ncbi:MAG: ExeM/NucH family extracellular endonuclease, partial [Microbacteriaceae bacterium]|nr:ExeM/NucH family extracellular endonuclease [Microbacteriaceae bacterium]
MVSAPAQANTAGTGLVISEAYGGGGNASASYKADFIELYNPTCTPVSLGGLYLQAASSGGASTSSYSGSPFALSGTVPAHGYWLVQASSAGANGADLPAPDQSVGFNMGAGGFQIGVISSGTAISTSGSIVGNASVVDYVGVNSAIFEGTKTGAISGNVNSAQRKVAGDFVYQDTDVNSADFTVNTSATPRNSSSVEAGCESGPVDTAPGFTAAAGALAAGSLSTPYSVDLGVTGTPAPTATVSAGSLPTGLTLSAAGVISGTPSAAGDFSFSVTAANGVSPDATRAYTIQITSGTAPAFTAAAGALAAGKAGTVYASVNLGVTGTPTPTASISAGALPTGLSLSAAGVVSGTPTAAGDFSFTVLAANGISPDATRAYSIHVDPANVKPVGPSVVINEVYGGGGNAGAAYERDFVELYNTTDAPISLAGWTLQYGAANTTAISATGNRHVLTGTIPAHSTWLVAEALGGTVYPTYPHLPAPDETGSLAMGGTTGKIFLTYNESFVTTGVAQENVIDAVLWESSSPDAGWYEGTGSAPSTANATSASRDASHTDTNDNAADFTVGTPTPMNSLGQTEYVAPPQPAFVTATLPAATVGFPYSQTIAVTGTPTPTLAVTAGSLPAGLGLSAAGLVSGTPTATGSSTFTVTASNGVEPAATKEFTVTVGAATVTPIAELQGTTATSPKNGQPVATQGVVTAIYPYSSGRFSGFNGFTIQTPGIDYASTPGSDAVFVYTNPGGFDGGSAASNTALEAFYAQLAVGEIVKVTGTVSEYQGLTEVNLTSSSNYQEVDVDGTPGTDTATIVPLTGAWPLPNLESVESMVYDPSAGNAGKWWITDTYDLNFTGDIGLAYGSGPLVQPTEVAPHPATTAEYKALVDAELARSVTLDDTYAVTNYTTGTNRSTPLYLDESDALQVRVGAEVTFHENVIIDARSNAFKLQATHNQTRTVGGGGYTGFVEFEQTRTDAPELSEAERGDFTIGTFNVLNYFTTGSQEWLDSPQGQLFLAQYPDWLATHCLDYPDRDGNPLTVDGRVKDGGFCQSDDNDLQAWAGPRGASNDTSLARQQSKIVAAINGLDASVVGLLEIENSAKLGEARDEALATLTAALNDAADGTVDGVVSGEPKWAFVPSSLQLPPVAQQDVIKTAIIYQPAEVRPAGASLALGTESYNASGNSMPGAFANAREPIGQWFQPVDAEGEDDGEPVLVIVNHFKSKGSVGPWPGDTQAAGLGQGSSNESRVRQAEALKTWVESISEPGDSVALIGDFNSYTMEDPLLHLYADSDADPDSDPDFIETTSTFNPGDTSYSFSLSYATGSSSFASAVGSLDHVLVSPALAARVTGEDVWNINAEESVGLEYSRYNYSGETTYDGTAPYRSSDHNPVILGVEKGETPVTTPDDSLQLDILDINDFHGRIAENDTNLFAATVELLRAENPDGTLFAAAGDNVGASLFASAYADDQPTIEVLNALGLDVSAVGNHEFDQGFADLTGRIEPAADWDYLGANVFEEGETDPAMQPYEVRTVTLDGVPVRVGFVGVVTPETASLVSPAGIAGLEY